MWLTWGTTATAAPTRRWLQGWLPHVMLFTVQRRRCMGGAAVLHPTLDPARSCTKAGPWRCRRPHRRTERMLGPSSQQRWLCDRYGVTCDLPVLTTSSRAALRRVTSPWELSTVAPQPARPGARCARRGNTEARTLPHLVVNRGIGWDRGDTTSALRKTRERKRALHGPSPASATRGGTLQGAARECSHVARKRVRRSPSRWVFVFI